MLLPSAQEEALGGVISSQASSVSRGLRNPGLTQTQHLNISFKGFICAAQVTPTVCVPLASHFLRVQRLINSRKLR